MQPNPKPLMRPDGSFDVVRLGVQKSWGRDLYHWLLTIRWLAFLSLLTAGYLLLNLVFALLYGLEPQGVQNIQRDFWDHFFFSVQTMSTVGYGFMYPVSVYSQSLMVLQSLVGFLYTAVSTGLIFAKFSRLQARVLFSENTLIHPYEGQQVLTFRAANLRNAHIVDATLKLSLAINEVSQEGMSHRRIYDLKLVRDTSPLFALVWNVYHPLTHDSPLWQHDLESLKAGSAALLLTFSGVDDRLGQVLHTRHAYNWDQLRFQQRFVDIISQNDGQRIIDYRKFHLYEPVVQQGPAV